MATPALPGAAPAAQGGLRPRRTVAEKLSSAGTPDERTRKIDIAAAGVNHMILAVTDPAMVKAFTGRELANVPDVKGSSDSSTTR